uniref:Transmembrane protein n=1 Tax=Panagrellus redivivus TaxID=6233 RepID=A0A7E4UMB7_PANRE
MQYDNEHVSTVQHQINFTIQKQNTKMIMHAMLLDIFVDFIPHFAAFLIHTYTNPKLIDFGLPPMITSIQVAISGILYVRPWRQRLKRSNSTHPS